MKAAISPPFAAPDAAPFVAPVNLSKNPIFFYLFVIYLFIEFKKKLFSKKKIKIKMKPKKSTFFFTEEEKQVFKADIVSYELLKQTSLYWWYNKINKKEHQEFWGYNDVMKEIEYSPPTKTMKRGGILYQKGLESFSNVRKEFI